MMKIIKAWLVIHGNQEWKAVRSVTFTAKNLAYGNKI